VTTARRRHLCRVRFVSTRLLPNLYHARSRATLPTNARLLQQLHKYKSFAILALCARSRRQWSARNVRINTQTCEVSWSHTCACTFAERLIDQLTQETYECMICSEPIGRSHWVWSCRKCYAVFHFHPRYELSCVTQWAKKSDLAQCKCWFRPVRVTCAFSGNLALSRLSECKRCFTNRLRVLLRQGAATARQTR
jgi:hypothetical protein